MKLNHLLGLIFRAWDWLYLKRNVTILLNMDTDLTSQKSELRPESARRWKNFPGGAGGGIHRFGRAVEGADAQRAHHFFFRAAAGRTGHLAGAGTFAGVGNHLRPALFRRGETNLRARELKNLATDIVTGKFGVREPAASCAEIPLEKFDLVLVPGMAFDL